MTLYDRPFQTFDTSLHSPHLQHSDTRLHLWTAFGGPAIRRHGPICLRACHHPVGILDVFGYHLRHHWRGDMDRCSSVLWIWNGNLEPGRVIYRAKVVAGD